MVVSNHALLLHGDYHFLLDFFVFPKHVLHLLNLYSKKILLLFPEKHISNACLEKPGTIFPVEYEDRSFHLLCSLKYTQSSAWLLVCSQ